MIVGLDQETVTGIDDIARVLDGTRIDKRVAMRILRDGRLGTVEIVPTERLPERSSSRSSSPGSSDQRTPAHMRAVTSRRVARSIPARGPE